MLFFISLKFQNAATITADTLPLPQNIIYLFITFGGNQTNPNSANIMAMGLGQACMA